MSLRMKHQRGMSLLLSAPVRMTVTVGQVELFRTLLSLESNTRGSSKHLQHRDYLPTVSTVLSKPEILKALEHHSL